ncbi:MAG: hypothetical protein RL169_1457 [Armatimonadota bacterium]|jgi:Tfp pilus assembly protein PilV
MKHRSTGVSLAEVIIASGISSIIVLFVVSTAIAISKFSQQALMSRIVDTQVSQGVDAIAKELRDGIAILPSTVIRGTTYSTSSTCVVLSATGYDFSKANPILESTDTVVFAFVPAASQVARTCLPGLGSKRPGGSGSNVTACTDAKFTYRVSEVIDWLNSSSTSITQSFMLATVPIEQPACTRNGITIPCTWQAGSQAVSVQVPAGPSIIGVQYKVTPTAASCPHITSVELQSKRSTSSLNSSPYMTTHITEARLRNKR